MSGAPKCFKCKAELKADFVGRRDTCDRCSADVHVCYNCKHYDARAYNECREPQAERVVDKDKSNFCDYFCLADSAAGGSGQETKEDVFKKLDSLFKK